MSDTPSYQKRHGQVRARATGGLSSWAVVQTLYMMCVKLPLYMMCVRLTALLAYLQVPEGVDPAALIKNAMDKYELEIAGGLGPSAGKCFRIGVMGYNAKPQNMALVVEAFRDGGCVCECVREGGAPLLWRVCGLVLGCGLWIMGYNAKPHINHGAGGGGFQRRWVCEGDLCCKEGGGCLSVGVVGCNRMRALDGGQRNTHCSENASG